MSADLMSQEKKDRKDREKIEKKDREKRHGEKTGRKE